MKLAHSSPTYAARNTPSRATSCRRRPIAGQVAKAPTERSIVRPPLWTCFTGLSGCSAPPAAEGVCTQCDIVLGGATARRLASQGVNARGKPCVRKAARRHGRHPPMHRRAFYWPTWIGYAGTRRRYNRLHRQTEGRPEMQEGSEYAVLHEFVTLAKRNVTQGTWDYIVGGAETETTQERNRVALDSIAFRPRVLRDVEHVDTSVTLLGLKLQLPLILAPIGSLQDFAPEGGVVSEPGGGARRRAAHAEFGQCAGHRGGGRQQSASQAVPALCPRRRRLGREPHRAGHRERLQGAVLHGRPRLVRPARARPRQALQDHLAPQRAGRPLPGALLLEVAGAAAQEILDPVHAEGHCHRRGRADGTGAWRREHLRLQPRRAAARSRQGLDRRAAGDRRGGEGARRDHRRRRLPARRRHRQGHGARAPTRSASAGCRAWPWRQAARMASCA